MSYQKRSSWDIIEDILTVISKESRRKTHILYRANLNSAQNDLYINHLLKNNLIIKSGRFYNLTPKGAEVLTGIRNLKSMVDDINIYPHEKESPLIRRYKY